MKTYLKDLTPDEVIIRLKAGEVVKHEKGNYEKKWIDGIICTIFNAGGFVINDCLGCDESAYFETPDELKLEVGKKYKTRDNRTVFIYNFDEKLDYPFCGVIMGTSDCCYNWGKNGRFYYSEETEDDLISEWSDDDDKGN